VKRIREGKPGRHTYNLGVSTITQQPPYLSVREAAALLGVHQNSIRRYIARGELPACRLGHGARARVRIDPRDLGALTEPMHPRWPVRDWRVDHPRQEREAITNA
jgi:excisionase family DNA binding protein